MKPREFTRAEADRRCRQRYGLTYRELRDEISRLTDAVCQEYPMLRFVPMMVVETFGELMNLYAQNGVPGRVVFAIMGSQSGLTSLAGMTLGNLYGWNVGCDAMAEGQNDWPDA